jgi:hypothetical protein
MHGRPYSLRLRAALACVPALALVLAASAGTATAARAPVHTRADLRTALEHLLAGWHPTNRAVHGAVVRGTGVKTVTSSNWSGYADDNSGSNIYKRVKGKWTEPAITGCSASSPLSAVVFWVGLDGFNDQTVEQAGTAAICGGGNPITYLTWWEMFPSNNIQFVGATVQPGDQISASVIKRGGKYTLAVTDATTSGNSFSTTQHCRSSVCKDQSAEWIAEAPSTSSGEVPLPSFGTWFLKHAKVKSGTTLGTISSFPDDRIIMDDSSPHNVAKPGQLNAKGNRFKDTWRR